MNTPGRQRRDLTLAEVVDRAMEIAAAEGEQGLTMRRVAEACNVTPMALYHHVANKEALLTAIVDRVVADAIGEFGNADRPWRDDLRDFACRYRAGFLDHPTAAEVYVRRPVLSEALARCTELMLHAFERGGVERARIAGSVDAVVLLVMGSIANDLTRPAGIRDELTEHLPAEETPLLRERITEYSHRDAEQRFRQALDWLLDGMLAAD